MSFPTQDAFVEGPPGAHSGSLDGAECTSAPSTAVLDVMHVGDVRGGLGSIRLSDHGPRRGARAKLKTLLAILGPGLIVMVGDNDAGAFGTYTQAGQNYGTTLVWTLLLLVPVLYVNQEMVVRLGLVTGVGHARLILERFGKFWGAFSVIDLFLLNALTIVTEFIGITLAVGYLGLPKMPSVLLAAVVVVAAASTGSFQRFERLCLVLIGVSLLLVPIYVLAHPPLGHISHDLITPAFPHGARLADVMLLIIGIVGTTVAPWQLFFQQSYVVDKRLTPRFMRYEKADLWIGIVIVVIGGTAMFGFSYAAFHGHPEAGNFTDARGVVEGLGRYVSHTAGILFAITLLDASIIGAAAVGLATSYAVSDVLGVNHSLHRKPSDAKGFYAIYATLMALAATVVLIPGSPLGLLTTGVQTLAGVLLPSATVFLLLLCNDKEVLGPWVNSRRRNALTAAIIWILVLLSVILTAAVLFPDITGTIIVQILSFGSLLGASIGFGLLLQKRRFRLKPFPAAEPPAQMGTQDKQNWRMPVLQMLERPIMTTQRKTGLTVLRSYLLLATTLVIVKIVQVAAGN